MPPGLMASGQRRTKEEMAHFRQTIHDICAAHRPVTVRQVFYQMVAKGLEKSENQYVRVQQELLKQRRGEAEPRVPWSWVTDETRWMRKPTSYEGLSEVLDITAGAYRRKLWAAQDVYVEVWCEKDALAGSLYDVTSDWDVPLMVSRGFASASFLHSAAGTIRSKTKPAHLYIFADRDASGDLIAEKIEQGLSHHGASAECHRAAVTQEQVEEFDLPTRPAKGGGGQAVELDAIPPDKLREITRECIEKHIDHDVLERTREIEEQERETLQQIYERFGGAA